MNTITAWGEARAWNSWFSKRKPNDVQDLQAAIQCDRDAEIIENTEIAPCLDMDHFQGWH